MSRAVSPGQFSVRAPTGVPSREILLWPWPPAWPPTHWFHPGGSELAPHAFLCPQVVIICLVVLDALLVLAELILDLRIIKPDQNNYAARVLSIDTEGGQSGGKRALAGGSVGILA